MENYNFEEALNRLEVLVGQLEEGDLELEKALTVFEEGIKLTAFCHKKLGEAEGKIEELVMENNEVSWKIWREGAQE